MGRLNTAPKQAQRIFLLFKTLCTIPIIRTVITVKVTILVISG